MALTLGPLDYFSLPSTPAHAQPRVAHVIGNGAYQHVGAAIRATRNEIHGGLLHCLDPRAAV